MASATLADTAAAADDICGICRNVKADQPIQILTCGHWVCDVCAKECCQITSTLLEDMARPTCRKTAQDMAAAESNVRAPEVVNIPGEESERDNDHATDTVGVQ